MTQDTNMTATAELPAVSQEDRLRADLYNFLGALLAGPPDDMLLSQTAGLSGDDSDLGTAINALAKIASLSKPQTVEREFNKLFIGLGRGELLPYASYYMTGFLNEKPLATLRQDMAARGLSRADNVYEPEDNIASLMEMMGALIVGRFGTPATLADQKTFFNRHISPWAGHFYSDLEAAKNSVFYAAVGAVGRVFVDIETEGFRMSAE
ncbi:molecular chaperone TorD family protein [Shimia thalassica]|uniref:TorD/DmsD family molecular chaperone n=1 Tax=Shimia thalassica TaxID=1715693 RepID=UPI002090A861|nr:molecular chaperone TorD family protein [Shimia thalassica]MDO6502266.1 molecular chaperone TorD family protein [Shimia thalassica]MDO6520012.1 molecular chaperone TorD family protein [Shimia thalassica]MDO6797406.1 molecular chaperone TorD family protein [Shimia thalassica]MDP2492996.1 molecular chaperone TorD family protein [Shimia thalassica]MDP2518208.1 molecular chaperone TorD family protein [Shimia thalassica]